MKTTHKVAINNGAILLLMMVTVLAGASGIKRLDSTVTAMNAVHLQSVSLVLKLDLSLHRALINERSMLSRDLAFARSNDLERRSEFRSAEVYWGQYKPLATTDEEQNLFEPFEAAVKEWEEESDKTAAIALSGSPDAPERAVSQSLENSGASFDRLSPLLTSLAELSTKAAEAAREVGAKERAKALSLLYTCAVLTTLAGVALALVMGRLAALPIQHLTEALSGAAEGDGDLTITLDESSNDEMGEVAKWFNLFSGRISETLRAVWETADRVAATSDMLTRSADETSQVTAQIAGAIQQVASGSQDQSESARKTAVAVDHLAEAIGQVASGTERQTIGVHQATEVAGESDKRLREMLEMLEMTGSCGERNAAVAAQGAQAVQKVLSNMDSIRVTTGNITSCIGELDGYSTEIGRIVEVINGISAQTNLLALNAAIEAARAGEHGRGFAVVSEEVRKLAEDSSRETKAIGALVSRISMATRNAVAAATSGAGEVEAGSVLAREASLSLDHIYQGAMETQTMIASLTELAHHVEEAGQSVQRTLATIVDLAEGNAVAVDSMTVSAEEVRRLVDNVAAVSEESAAATEEVSASAEEMSESIREVHESALALSQSAKSLKDTVEEYHTG